MDVNVAVASIEPDVGAQGLESIGTGFEAMNGNSRRPRLHQHRKESDVGADIHDHVAGPRNVEIIAKIFTAFEDLSEKVKGIVRGSVREHRPAAHPKRRQGTAIAVGGPYLRPVRKASHEADEFFQGRAFAHRESGRPTRQKSAPPDPELTWNCRNC